MADYELLSLNEATPQIIAPTASDRGKLTSGQLISGVADGSSNTAWELDSSAYSTEGARLLSITNNTVEKFNVSKDGNINVTPTSNTVSKLLVCHGSTTDATPTNINTDGGTTNRMIIPINTMWGFFIQLTVREQTTGDSKYLEYRGAIKRDGTTNTSLVGGISEDLIAEDTGAATWSAAVTADDTNEALQIQVTGEASHTLKWVASVNITGVSG